MTVTWKKLAYAEDTVANSVLTANSVLVAIVNATPVPLSMTASTILARLAAGDIVAASVSDILTLLNVEAGADVTGATNVAAAGAVMESDFTALGDLLVGSGSGTAAMLSLAGSNADVGKFLKVGAADVLEWDDLPAGGGGDFMADGSVPMTDDLQFDDNEAMDLVIQTVADETAVLAYSPAVIGKMLWSTAELAPYICTSAT